jgi:hypothetical protein
LLRFPFKIQSDAAKIEQSSAHQHETPSARN